MRALILGLSLSFLLVGCSESKSGASAVSADDVTPKKVAAAWPTDVKIHRNEKGEPVCPIMKASMDSPDQTVGFQDYKGVRYYFCCDMCPDKFKQNPALYAQ